LWPQAAFLRDAEPAAARHGQAPDHADIKTQHRAFCKPSARSYHQLALGRMGGLDRGLIPASLGQARKGWPPTIRLVPGEGSVGGEVCAAPCFCGPMAAESTRAFPPPPGDRQTGPPVSRRPFFTARQDAQHGAGLRQLAALNGMNLSSVIWSAGRLSKRCRARRRPTWTSPRSRRYQNSAPRVLQTVSAELPPTCPRTHGRAR
jgi:hypothetical protein